MLSSSSCDTRHVSTSRVSQLDMAGFGFVLHLVERQDFGLYNWLHNALGVLKHLPKGDSSQLKPLNHNNNNTMWTGVVPPLLMQSC